MLLAEFGDQGESAPRAEYYVHKQVTLIVRVFVGAQLMQITFPRGVRKRMAHARAKEKLLSSAMSD